ncbi:unnamed protein product [Rotaria socialis]|uniref:Uncharacterized protein n=2 Tax=Rotaria socialis TaxID=392032 RepID=A0A817TAX9_9BILA|nr:unnamed protein product [Rotaria socialis]CAF3304458.1 unnamed protein product [Rotaria socialis]CAF3311676.1 unnamed protein product [Rotaria socialis]CAF3325120.1 unnamed protein product [Rotaria socialis]CAF3571803.1 unnamed protein product [Rotaria socialis]
MSGSFTKNNSRLPYLKEKSEPMIFVSNPKSDKNNIRSRYNRSNIPTTSTSNPTDFIVNTSGFQSNDKYNDIRFVNRNKHNCIQIILMVVAALLYLLDTLRAYIPSALQKDSKLWSILAVRPITRVYTSDLRPSVLIETLAFRLIENWQTLWLIYILSFIPRRCHFGYLYRNLNIFNSLFCFFLIVSLLLQIVSQLSLSSDISCACLYLSFILLCVACRFAAVKLLKSEKIYASTNLSIDLAIVRHFILNSLFLYTTSIAYTTMCATVEYVGTHMDRDVGLPISLSIGTTIGLSIILFLLIVYFILDLFFYKNEFRSIWTPYLFIVYIFNGSTLRQLSFLETDNMSNDLNYYLCGALCCSTLLIMIILLCRQIFVKCCRKMKKAPTSSQAVSETEVQ